MRCGSTWLCAVLKQHPDLRIADEKEMDFFFMPRMLEHDLRWYAAHFAPQSGEQPKPVRGEVSPRYARLKGWQVRRIAELLPDLRIILTLRHPIKRAWSQALYDFGHLTKRDVRTVRPFEFMRQLERARSRLSSDYPRMIRIWSDAFGREALHIDFFDRLRDDPQPYVNDVLKHLGASTPWTLPDSFVNKKVWATNSLVKHEPAIPEVVQCYIAGRLLKPTEQLNEMLEGRVTHWVEEMRGLRSRRRPSWRILEAINRILFALPERSAYEAYHAIMDLQLYSRWRQIRAEGASCGEVSPQPGFVRSERIG